ARRSPSTRRAAGASLAHPRGEYRNGTRPFPAPGSARRTFHLRAAPWFGTPNLLPESSLIGKDARVVDGLSRERDFSGALVPSRPPAERVFLRHAELSPTAEARPDRRPRAAPEPSVRIDGEAAH